MLQREHHLLPAAQAEVWHRIPLPLGGEGKGGAFVVRAITTCTRPANIERIKSLWNSLMTEDELLVSELFSALSLIKNAM
jgi:hypothetical protein